jgi:hypothetical protein
MKALTFDRRDPRLVLAAVGLFQGLVYYLAHEFWPEDPTARALVIAPVFFVSVAAAVVHLSWTGTDIKRLAMQSCGAGLVFALLAIWVWLQIPADDAPYRMDDMRAGTLTAGTVMAVYALLPFLQIYQATGRREYPYAGLFRHAWNNFYILAIGGLFAGAFWLIIVLWFELFKLIDVTFFEEVFTHAAFVSMSLTTVFGYGVALGRESERITNTLRGITLAVFRTLMPLLALIVLLFLVSLPFTGLQPLWDTGHASAVLLALIGLTVLFLNGVYQDGTGAPPYDRRVRLGLEAALVGLPIYVVITFYALGLRIGQYGLTPPRFYGLVFTTGAALYAIGYTIAVLRRGGEWMYGIRRVNMWMVWVITATVIMVHTPLLDPLSRSAENQSTRLVEQNVPAREFDYGYLRYQLGHAGWEKLAELEQLTDHPEATIIADGVERARNADSYWELRRLPTTLLSAADVQLLEPTVVPPASLWDFVAEDLTRDQTDECLESESCLLFAATIDVDPDNEWVLVLSGDDYYGILAYDTNADAEWERIGWVNPVQPDTLPVRDVFLNDLRATGVELVEAPYRDLMIGGIRLRVRQ